MDEVTTYSKDNRTKPTANAFNLSSAANYKLSHSSILLDHTAINTKQMLTYE